MTRPPSLQTIVDLAANKVSSSKLRQLVKQLEAALASPLSSQPIDDPMVIRRRLVRQMKQEGASSGTIQAMEQFFMGIVRRAAVDGIIQAPPEGPWTRAWQAVLESSERNKSQVRVLAAWATDQRLEPANVSTRTLWEFAKKANWDAEIVALIESRLSGSASVSSGDCTLTKRLKLKAMHGSVNSRARK